MYDDNMFDTEVLAPAINSEIELSSEQSHDNVVSISESQLAFNAIFGVKDAQDVSNSRGLRPLEFLQDVLTRLKGGEVIDREMLSQIDITGNEEIDREIRALTENIIIVSSGEDIGQQAEAAVRDTLKLEEGSDILSYIEILSENGTLTEEGYAAINAQIIAPHKREIIRAKTPIDFANKVQLQPTGADFRGVNECIPFSTMNLLSFADQAGKDLPSVPLDLLQQLPVRGTYREAFSSDGSGLGLQDILTNYGYTVDSILDWQTIVNSMIDNSGGFLLRYAEDHMVAVADIRLNNNIVEFGIANSLTEYPLYGQAGPFVWVDAKTVMHDVMTREGNDGRSKKTTADVIAVRWDGSEQVKDQLDPIEITFD